ncbi:redoxin domain-containing protein [Reichenbachiella agarivorans]|uniref:Redoxin domain-containing protein n=1 Tax=Reichenbachiella agarivorans TaxID=2979464 RepID=A0ABY6CN50_9BACT|nr:redoxin domain-containing protein [Reichenbachiella agarivorans]UXP31944.1 redoxin domain-containing protein [Reichenbachiella agarivorans]
MSKYILFILANLSSLFVSAQDVNLDALKLWNVQKEDIVNLPINKGITVILFTSTDCPYDQLYEDRIFALQKKYGGKADFFMINANTPSNTGDNSTKTKAQAKQYNIPYFIDQNLDAVRVFQIEKSPEAVVLTTKNGNTTMVYHGAIDDNPQSENNVRVKYLESVLNNVIQNKTSPYDFKRAAGCRIR